MSRDDSETATTRGLGWLVKAAKAYRAKLALYLVLIAAFWASLATFSKALEFLFGPAPPVGSDRIRYYVNVIGIGLGLPTLVLVLAEALPALCRRWLARRLEKWSVPGEAYPRYFRLAPYEREDRDRYRRADGAQDEILAWLRRDGPTILYITGLSGAGKSSLLNASVLPALEAGDPPTMTLSLRPLGDPVADLAESLVKPEVVYKKPSRDLPSEILPLLRRVDNFLEEKGRRLLVLFDQFEEYMITFDSETPRPDHLRPLLTELQSKPLNNVIILMSFRSDYEKDVERLNYPLLRQNVNWKQVDSFPVSRARDFLRDGFQGQEIGTELIDQVVRHASELDDTRGKVRPVVLNMIGLALDARSSKAGGVLGPRESQRLMLDHVRDGLKHPRCRDHAPRLLKVMVTPEGRKKRPASAADLSRQAGLDVPQALECLSGLQLLGFVRPFQPHRDQLAGTQTWEVSHDFVARLLSLILPAWKPSIASRLRQALGPTLMVFGTVAVFAMTQLYTSEEEKRSQSIDRLQKWAGRPGVSITLLEDRTFSILIDPTSSEETDLTGKLLREDLTPFVGLISSLKFASHGLTSLPPEVGKLTNLTSLDLYRSELPTLPLELWGLTNLTSLDLEGNELMSLPPAVGQLGNLTYLNLGGNRLTSLPPELWGLAKLTSLDLERNSLPSLPREMGQLINLTYLDLGVNRLTSLPPELWGLTKLTSLDIGGNPLTSLPPAVGQLTGLTKLSLYTNGLTSLPAEVGRLTGLTSLDLRSNQLTSLPPEVSQLTGLTSLDLRGNRLTSLPPEVRRLTGLLVLDLGDNQLTSVPSELWGLTKLISLDLRGNKLTSLPAEVGRLTGLTELKLGDNGLTSLPPEVGQLSNLTYLDLSGNGLTSLPAEVGRLTGLTDLNLSSNGLTSLPPEVGRLSSLATLHLINTTALQDPPPEVVRRGTRAILEFLLAKIPLDSETVAPATPGGLPSSRP